MSRPFSSRQISLVTGAPRSSTTFVGRMLALPRSVAYLDEPFNRQTGISGLDYQFLYLNDENGPRYDPLIHDLLSGRAHYQDTELAHPTANPLKKVARKAGFSTVGLKYRAQVTDPRVRHLLIKDPMATMAAQYLYRHYGAKVIMMARHPASTIASYKRLGWSFGLPELAGQPLLMRDYLQDTLGPILERQKKQGISQVEEWSYFWLSFYTVVEKFMQDNPEFVLVRHEDISLRPEEEFARLYKLLGLEFTSEIRRTIDEYTSGKNPADPEGQVHVLKRNSAENIHRWRAILNAEEVAVIKRITGELAGRFGYPDW